MNYGFERVRMIDVIDKNLVEKKVFVRGGEQAILRVMPGENLTFPLMAGEDPKFLKVTYDLPKIVDASNGIREGKILGEAVLRYDGKPVARVPLIACESVAEGFSLGSFLVTIAAPRLQIKSACETVNV